MNIQCSCGSRSFVKERKALKMSQPSEFDSDQLSAIIKADPLKTTREVAEELNVDHSMVIWHLKQIEKVKSSISGCLWAVWKSKILSFEVCLLRNNGKPFLDQLVMCNEMWILYDHWQRPSVTGPRRSSKALPKVKLAPKKSWSLFGGLLLVWTTSTFWIPAKPLRLRSMLSEWMRYTENFCVCNWQRSTEWAPFSMMIPNCMLHNQHFKSWTNKKFPIKGVLILQPRKYLHR